MSNPLDIINIQTGRTIVGYSAVYLPWTSPAQPDWDAFDGQLQRTIAAGLIPAVNMDTGFAQLLTAQQRIKILRRTHEAADNATFAAGVFVNDAAGSDFDENAYQRGIEEVVNHGGMPVIMQSFGLTHLDDADRLAAYESFGNQGDFIAFELGKMFAPFGDIYSLEFYERLIQIPSCIAAKHSSLSRALEWQRLAIRDRVRPEFRCLTGNDLAIDMIMYGCDYLLGLSAFDPAAFAQRDQWWQENDLRFYELNDALQYLGNFAFREPVPAYKHCAGMYLKMMGRVPSDEVPAACPRRPDSDLPILRDISIRIESQLNH